MPTLHLENVTKNYKSEGRVFSAVSDATISIDQGEFVFIVGSSGAGKSSLLSLMTGEVRPNRGSVFLGDSDLARLPAWRLPKVRRSFGRVWQDSRLIRRSCIYDNLAVAARAAGERDKQIHAKVTKALGIVGMAGVEQRYPAELSIGECRRVELARALINSPSILVLDELTANLDNDNIWDILHLLNELNRNGTTVIMATHARQFVSIMCRRVVTLVDGKIFGDVKKGKYGDIV